MDPRKLAHYELSGLLGKGGMGEVYRARDTKLEREVAIKLLPTEMSGDPERIARFQREARTLATLQHPNVASVYGFEETADQRFLVMELVEGEGLDERLSRGPLAIQAVIDITKQLAEGLEAAHERNIVHRDLKPANIKLDPDGVVKILDFGLARAYTGDPEDESNIANSPTITAAMTQAGTILGTAAYMSPEQAKGRAVDKRADIWAMGAILFELLTGRRLFDAETVSETIASVLMTEVDWEALPPETPPALRSLMERCLERDPRLRLRDVGEARILLSNPDAARGGSPQRASGGGAARGRTLLWSAAILAALALGVAGGRILSSAPERAELPPLLFEIPDDPESLVVGSLALSPDGRHLVFARRDSVGHQDLWIRRLDESEARPLLGSRGGRLPFWSADGTKIGFFVDNSIFRTTPDGGSSSLVATLPRQPMGGSWSSNDVILAGSNDGPIFRVAASGGDPVAVTSVDSEYEDAHCWPVFLPDGEHFVFLSDAGNDEGHRLYVHSLDGKEKKILRKGLRSAIHVDPAGALLLSHNDQLFAQPFDFARREPIGELLLVQDKLSPIGDRHHLAFSLSSNGVFAFQMPSDAATMQRIPLDGSAPRQILSPSRYRNPRLSPDGRKLAFEIQSTSDERVIWVEDLQRGARTLISERGEISDSPVWSHDGQSIYFGSSLKGGHWRVYRKLVQGGSPPELLGGPPGSDDIAVLDASSDGKWLLVSGNGAETGQDLFIARVGSDSLEYTPWLASTAHEQFARFSPDSRWIAFESNTSGKREIYVAPREGGPQSQQWLVSVGGGTDPAWSRDGSRLFYTDYNKTLTESRVVERGDELEFDAPIRRRRLDPPQVGYLRNAYDVYPDGTAVIAFEEWGDEKPTIRVRTGWRKW